MRLQKSIQIEVITHHGACYHGVCTDPHKNLREDPHGTSGWALREAIPDEIKPSFNTAAFADPGQAGIDGASPQRPVLGSRYKIIDDEAGSSAIMTRPTGTDHREV